MLVKRGRRSRHLQREFGAYRPKGEASSRWRHARLAVDSRQREILRLVARDELAAARKVGCLGVFDRRGVGRRTIGGLGRNFAPHEAKRRLRRHVGRVDCRLV